MPKENKRTKSLADLNPEMVKLFPQYEEKLAEVGNRQQLDLDLCGHGIVSEADLLGVYSRVSGLSLIEEEEFQSAEIFPELPTDFLIHHNILPYRWDEKSLEMVVSDPYNLEKLRYLFFKLHHREVSFMLARRSHVERIISAVYMNEHSVEEDEFGFSYSGEESEEELMNLASEAKIVRLVNEMFSRAIELEASDIHVEPDEKKLAVRFRIDGKLQEIMNPPLNLYPAIASRIKLIGGINIAERRLPQDGRTDLTIGRSLLDVRISTIPTMNGESIVLRILRKDIIEFNLKSIGMDDKMCGEFEQLIQLPHGIILVVGPTGSGKSTTLYSVLSRINTTDRKIITIEDPVEYQTENIQQIQVNPKIGLDFASGLRHIVRQDPDVIMVGEIRDRETAEIAIHAALTGHLVFSTLHTNDAPGAISRLLDMGIENFLVSSSLAGVLSQRLVRRLCKNCSGSGSLKNNNRCKKCSGRGFKGRIGIFELMVINDEVRDCINNNVDSSALAQVAVKHGMIPLVEDGNKKVAEGITTQIEVAGVAFDIIRE